MQEYVRSFKGRTVLSGSASVVGAALAAIISKVCLCLAHQLLRITPDSPRRGHFHPEKIRLSVFNRPLWWTSCALGRYWYFLYSCHARTGAGVLLLYSRVRWLGALLYRGA